MSNLFDVLRIGGNSLSAQQVATQVVGTNISSASVAGYHRQTAVYTSMNDLGGIRDVTVSRASDAFLETQINNQTAAFEFANQRSEGLGLIMEAVGAMDESGLNASMSDFFASWRNLNVAPQDLTVRRDVLVKSQIFGERVTEAALNLAASQKLADDDVVHTLPAINAGLQTIASLNQAIGQASALGQPDNSLMDQRDLAIHDLNKLVGISTCVEPTGNVTVLLGNISVVSETRAFEIVATPNSTTGLNNLSVAGTTQGVIDARITGGSIGATLSVRDNDIPQVLSTLDNFVFDFASAVNEVHEAGYGLDGGTGRALFYVPTTAPGAATTFAVSQDLQDTPAFLATAASVSGLPGDSTQALAITDLELQKICTDGSETPGNAVARIVSDSGQAVALSRGDRDRARTQMEQVAELFEQQNGVSLDEQMMMLSRIQNAFQASAKLVGVVERMLETLQNL